VAVLNADTMKADGHIKIMATRFVAQSIGAEEPKPTLGYIVPKKGQDLSKVMVGKKDSRVLKVDFVDVQQGDGTAANSSRIKRAVSSCS
jgi:hypothetical protein